MSDIPAGRLIRVDDTELYAVERGPEGALPLLVLHGGPGLDHAVFGSHLDALAETYRLVLVDGREQGHSARGTDPATWTLQQHARDVSALAASLGFARYAVLGHSFGAFVALQHAAAHDGGHGCAGGVRGVRERHKGAEGVPEDGIARETEGGGQGTDITGVLLQRPGGWVSATGAMALLAAIDEHKPVGLGQS